MRALAIVCERADRYNREAESRADRLADIPREVSASGQVADILEWDDLYRKEVERRKYLQEHQMLPEDEPQRAYRDNYEVPTTGVELGMSLRNLAKNVSVWKKRLNQDKFPDAQAKYEMYQKLYQEARTAVNQQRVSNQIAQNDADH